MMDEIDIEKNTWLGTYEILFDTDHGSILSVWESSQITCLKPISVIVVSQGKSSKSRK